MNINLKNDIKPISYIKTNAAEMMKYINDSKNPIIVTQNGEARGVLLDIESYQNMINAFSILKILQETEKDIQEKRLYENENVFNDIRKKLNNEMFVQKASPDIVEKEKQRLIELELKKESYQTQLDSIVWGSS